MFLHGFACDQAHSSLAAAATTASAPFPSPSSAAAHPFTRGLPTGLFASPPASPTHASSLHDAAGDIFTTCRSLQTALQSTAPASAPISTPSAVPSFPLTPPQQQHRHHEQLTPPFTHAPPPFKLRLRPRKAAATVSADSTSTDDSAAADTTTIDAYSTAARKRIIKRMPLTRNPNKRLRSVDQDHDGFEIRDDDIFPQPSLASYPFGSPSPSLAQAPALLPAPSLQLFRRSSHEDIFAVAAPVPTVTDPTTPPRPQTPRRSRIAPEALPLGLARSDFHTLHADGVPDDSSRSAAPVEVEVDGESWSSEDDRMLVELVLDKLQLSKTDWQDCARSLGKKDRQSVGRRWKSLMLGGDIGLRPGARSNRRGRIHATWR
ncbi:DNA-binding protein [Grosmannia clavigera kw1407]|uniref:DNA-binding protein n=1 Tax=Grosmannia clavigera (strain kw1407 / UAMH 11150) TaxID=655863 RepID=F0XIA3_GROCL|nr:DNA-binding protein [Grosmannia clavigera kw1407]EFX03118.1 DNA-binding protein [Grosmannia clavigera kw1407]